MDEAAFLAEAAYRGELVTYGEFASKFGGVARAQGKKLTEMGERLRAHGLPLLPVLVVNAETKLPSGDADFYKRLGLNEAALHAEQQRCFGFDWSTVPFGREAK